MKKNISRNRVNGFLNTDGRRIVNGEGEEVLLAGWGLGNWLLCEGYMWLAYNRGGIEKMSQGKFRTITMPIAINAICEDTVRAVTWLGADNGLYCYNKDNQFIENEITELCKGARIRHVGMTADKELLISSYSDVSQVRVTADNKITVWTMSDGLAGLKCRVSIKATDDKYYVGTTQGLSIIENDGSIHSITRKEGFDNERIGNSGSKSFERVYCTCKCRCAGVVRSAAI